MVSLKILCSHPVHYHAPIFRELTKNGVEIEVGYLKRGAAQQRAVDPEFEVEMKWDIDLLTGYPSRFFSSVTFDLKLLEQILLIPRVLRWTLQDSHIPLLLFGWPYHLIWLIWLIHIVSGRRVLITSETNTASFNKTPKPRWRVKLLQWLLQRSACFYIGSRNRQFLVEMGVAEELLFPLPYSIDNAFFSEKSQALLPSRRALCEEIGINPDLPVFLFCGKLIRKKRPIQLLKAYVAAGLKEKVQLLFVGDGSQRSELEALAKSLEAHHVFFRGFVGQLEMPSAYVLGELLCLLSDEDETWGLVVNEALACGRPVIISDQVGCGSDLVSSENGWIVPLDNQDELINILQIASRKYESWPYMGDIGRKKIEKHTFAAMAQSIRNYLFTSKS